MRFIWLRGKHARGRFAIVDDDIYKRIGKRRWWVGVDDSVIHNNTTLHRLVMGVTGAGRRVTVDHINFNRLDNRRANLRVVSVNENASRRRPKAPLPYRRPAEEARHLDPPWAEDV